MVRYSYKCNEVKKIVGYVLISMVVIIFVTILIAEIIVYGWWPFLLFAIVLAMAAIGGKMIE
jgi:uncharacterized membrane protein